MNIKILSIAALLALASCNGPWNVMPSDDIPRDPVLQVALFAVGNRNFDTLWLERTTPIGTGYDSTRRFVEDATILVSRDGDPTDSVSYRPSPGSGVAWLPSHPHPVKPGATYTLRAQVRWNASQQWPAGMDLRRTELIATTTVPSDWSVQAKAPEAPIEALIPTLSVGVVPLRDSSMLRLCDSVRPGSVARYGLTLETIDSVLAGLPVTRPIRWGDTVYYISGDFRRVTNFAGQEVGLSNRQYVYHTRRGAGFGGMFSVQKFDPLRAKIEAPFMAAMKKALGSPTPSTVDSASEYQPGGTRYYEGPYPAYGDMLYGWPDRIFTSNIAIGYTGLNRTYYYAVDPHYVTYSSTRKSIAGGDRTTVAYSNVKGGGGYFTGALVDSFAIHVEAMAVDTTPVEALRGAACRRQWYRYKNEGEGFDAGQCAGTDYTAAPVGEI